MLNAPKPNIFQLHVSCLMVLRGLSCLCMEIQRAVYAIRGPALVHMMADVGLPW